MPGDYQTLAPLYISAGLNAYSEQILPRLIEVAQRNDWIGRRVLDLGCGTANAWTHDNLTRVRYSIIGVDESAEMLRIAASQPRLLGEWIQGDIRRVEVQEPVDLVVAIDVLNELNALTDLESVFRVAAKALPKGKLFIFDMQTIEGLTQAGESGNVMLRDTENLVIFSVNEYDYERQMHTRTLTIFEQQDEGWMRSETRQTLRAYPIQAVATLLQRSGFTIKRILDAQLLPYDVGVSRSTRVYFFGIKQ